MEAVQGLLIWPLLLSLCWGCCNAFRAFPVSAKSGSESGVGYEWSTEFISQKIDHFGFVEGSTYSQRYLVNAQHYVKGGPIFFYTGNEGDIELFANNTGFVWELAPDYNAVVVFAEHRYYGQSMPFGEESYSSPEKLNYFTSEQALADFAVLGTFLKKNYPSAKLISFGGSYGGMLTAWFRMKYPHIVDGGLSASAPIYQSDTICSAFSAVVTKDFDDVSHLCSAGIRQVFQRLPHILETVGKEGFAKQINLCVPAMSADFSAWLQGILAYMAMVDYPYPASFLEPLPAWPIKEACKFFNQTTYSDDSLIVAMAKLSNLYQNYAHEVKCINTSSFAYQGLGNAGWNYQSCTEMVFPSCNVANTDFFPPSTWDVAAYSKSCHKQYGILPRGDWLTVQYGGRAAGLNLSGHSNIIFSNGKLDPWSAGGVLETSNPDIEVILIEDGAHHLDLRRSHPLDPASVIEARRQERNIISKWLGN